jgi:hypothetical protein
MKRTVIGIVAALASMAALTIAVIPLRDSRYARRRGDGTSPSLAPSAANCRNSVQIMKSTRGRAGGCRGSGFPAR